MAGTEDLDFTARPARSEIYDPSVARACFQSMGKVEIIPQGGNFFTENQGSDRMYMLVEGEVSLIRGKKAIDVVKPGEIFGEMATISQLPRSATAIARTPCRALSLDTKQFQTAIQQKAPEFALMLMNIMINRLRLTAAIVSRNVAAEQDLRERRVFDEKLLAELVERMQNRLPTHAPVNKVIMKEGEGGAFMYVVLEGRVVVSIKSRTVERVGPGGVFGEMALVDQSPRAASAVAETDCSLLAINRSDFLALIKSNPAFAVSLLRSLADRLRFMTSHHR
jgi:CRP-like cAMP-binding protein